MRDREYFSEAEVRQLCETLAERGQVIAQGLHALRLLRCAIERAHRDAGIVVVMDPNSSVDLSEWFGVTSLSAVRWAIAGGALGLLLCGLTNRAGLGTALAAGVGAVIGVVRGHEAVRRGWRLRSYQDDQGIVCVEVRALTC